MGKKQDSFERELDMAEFKGRTLATLDEIKVMLVEMKANADKHYTDDSNRFAGQDIRLQSLETSRSEFRGLSKTFAFVVAIASALITAGLMKVLGL